MSAMGVLDDRTAREPVLEVEDLRVALRPGSGGHRILEGVSYSLDAGSCVAMVGESGAGKSVSARAVLGLLDERRFDVTGRVRLCGEGLERLSQKERRRYVASVASIVFQDPTSALNPTMRVGWQIAEAMYASQVRSDKMSKTQARTASLELMREVGIADPEERFQSFPHQLSGGMRQRIVIAVALSCRPRVIFCDEPTSSLDVTTQAAIMDLLEELRDRLGIAMVLITHDLALASSRAERVMVMYGGRLVESLPAAGLFTKAAMPYTQALISALPDEEGGTLRSSRGGLGPVVRPAEGCVYTPGCPRAETRCASEAPSLTEIEPAHLCRCWFPTAMAEVEGA
jgi:oligopeptide/dipeptide ABC transporter ATP-binding protein